MPGMPIVTNGKGISMFYSGCKKIAKKYKMEIEKLCGVWSAASTPLINVFDWLIIKIKGESK